MSLSPKGFSLDVFSLRQYLRALKKNNFVEALSYLPSALRYQLPKQRWIANRLGLHRTILQQSNLFAHSKRAKLAKTVAILKREQLSTEHAKSYIDDILSSVYAKWHLEFIRDIAFKYPDLVFDFVEQHHKDNNYYLGLYLSLRLTRNSDLTPEQAQEFQILLTKLDNQLERTILSSNAFAHSEQEKLANLNRCFTEFGLQNLSLKNTDGCFEIGNLQTLPDHLKSLSHGAQNLSIKNNSVTVLVTCYNAQDTIEYCLRSLLVQTWQDLDIVVIDDASKDNTCDILSAISKQDARVRLIQLPYNVGTYGAKSLGALWATGKFMTCQDSDDFAHPQKIERQVRPLMDDETLTVTTSHWLRMDKHGQCYVRQYYPFLRQNPASPMFRREQVQKDTGLWHIVRTGADSEFFERLKLVYGKHSIRVIAEPLTLASHRENSLMTSSEFGAYEYQSAVDRLDYWENWRLWHIDTLSRRNLLKMPTLQQQLQQSNLFEVPQKITINIENLAKNLQLLKKYEEHL